MQDVASAQNETGIFFGEKRYTDAEDYYRKALKLREILASRFPSVATHPVNLGGSYCNLGHVHSIGKLDAAAAIPWYDKSIETLRKWSDQNAIPQARLFMFNALQGRAEAYFKLGNWEKSIADFRSASLLQPNNQSIKKRLDAAIKASQAPAETPDDSAPKL